MARSPLLQARKGHLGRGNEHEQQERQGQQKEEVRTGSLRTQNRHETGSTTARSVDEIALIRDTINHYGPVFIASLSIQIRRAGVQKNSAVGLVGAMGTPRAVSSSHRNGIACCRPTLCNRSIDLARECLDNSSA